ncbi:1-deoxy-D-xylulose-5-phosphate synthase [Kitasatospora sp. LaBMicrA B282]|uniref:1-deoxy-D-xylulose-5-phosphate synthase n=1 Tax=Kitasatospora sp. LaBMicrA B282 TaxID=3420949 RepID=UPI003D0C235B
MTLIQPESHGFPPSLRGLRHLESSALEALAAQVRRFLIDAVCATGGHLGPNLGVVELTIALHRVFESPRDALIFDTGHQIYVHKILTGRAGAFTGLRQAGGLSGYGSRAESEHDIVENSHASTALAYADGLAKARRLAGNADFVVAVVGDGALTGGMAWEALQNLGAGGLPVVVVLNDNGRSYAPTGGSLGEHLAQIRSHRVSRVHNVFTDLGFKYHGPVNGHSIDQVERELRRARTHRAPVVVHVVTEKGRGYTPAEQDDADRLHAVGVVDPVTGRPAKAGGRSWTSVFGHVLADLADVDERLVAVTASMLQPTGLGPMAERWPQRVFDVGICEQHAVAHAAGLALGGLHPVVAIYATFLNRAFDQVLMDVALHRAAVTFVLDRAGITGPDGASHHGMWDLAALRLVPGMRIAAPRDEVTLRALLTEAVQQDGPTVVRYPKAEVGASLVPMSRMDGVDVLRRTRSGALDVLLLPVGPLAVDALSAAERLEAAGLGVTVADPGWVWPVNRFLPGLAARHRLVVTVEDGVREGGIGQGVAQALADAGVRVPVTVLGLPTRFVPHGPRADLLAAHGLSAEGIAEAATESLQVAVKEGSP